MRRGFFSVRLHRMGDLLRYALEQIRLSLILPSGMLRGACSKKSICVDGSSARLFQSLVPATESGLIPMDRRFILLCVDMVLRTAWISAPGSTRSGTEQAGVR